MLKSRHRAKIDRLHERARALAREGAFDRALAPAFEAIEVAVRHGGPEDPVTAECFVFRAKVLEAAGDLASAESSYNRAYGILDATAGEATPLKAQVLFDYGSLYLRMGLDWRSFLLLDWARIRFTELEGPDSEDVARCWSMIALAQERIGSVAEAGAAYDEAIRILGAQLGVDHPSVVHLSVNKADGVAWDALRAGETDRAGEALDEMSALVAVLERAPVEHQGQLYNSKGMLGALFVEVERFEEGAELLQQSLAYESQTDGRMAGGRLRQLARAYASTGHPAEALAAFRMAGIESALEHEVAHGSERDRMRAVETTYLNLERFLDLVLLAGAQDPDVIAEVSDMVFRYKAFGAELLLRQNRAAAHSEDARLDAMVDELADRQVALAELELTNGEIDGQSLGDRERLEWEIASRVSEGEMPDRSQVDHDRIASLLPDGVVLIEFIRFTRRLLVDAAGDAQGWYVAFVVPSGPNGDVRLVDLGPADDIDRLVHAYRSELSRAGDTGVEHDPNPPDRGFGTSAVDDQSTAPRRNAGVELRRRVVDPLEQAARGSRRWLIAADGQLAQIPFEALPADSGGFLLDELEISYLGVGRDVAHLLSRSEPRTLQPALVFADPDYDLAAEGGFSAPDDTQSLRNDLNRAGTDFGRLPGTRVEGTRVGELLGVEPLLGGSAREGRLKEARSPVVLHIATHGFFLPPPEPEDAAGVRSNESRFGTGRRRLPRSGIALAGANSWLRGAQLPHDAEDAIITTADVGALDLLDTEMVVVSACETGLGDLVVGEGVMGLRRAFVVAGARTVVMSLWKVPDAQTEMLMTHFYSGLIAGKGRAEALRDAQQHVRSTHPDPYYWAAFICVGDPSPVHGIRP